MKKTFLAAAVLALLASTSAMALDTTNLYGGATLGESRAEVINQGVNQEATRQAGTVFIGKQFTPSVSAEISLVGAPKSDNLSSQALVLTGHYRYPVASTPLSVYGTLGAGTSELELGGDRGYRLSPVYGAGVEYALNQTWALRADYRVFSDFGSDGARNEFTTLGLKAKF